MGRKYPEWNDSHGKRALVVEKSKKLKFQGNRHHGEWAGVEWNEAGMVNFRVDTMGKRYGLKTSAGYCPVC